MKRPHLISVDELRAAGALDVPASWRKSLDAAERELPLFPDDDDELREIESQARCEADDDGSADDLQAPCDD